MRNKFEDKFEKRVTDSPAFEAPVPQEVKEGVLNFVVPKEIVDLPSKGRFYKPDHPLYNKEYIEIKQMTAKEEDILTNKSYLKKGVVIDRLLESIILDKSIDPSTILVGDKNAILVATRISAYGAFYDVSVTCVECGEKNILSIDLLETKTRDIDVIIEEVRVDKELQHDRLENGNISIKLPRTGWEVECKMLDGKDERLLLQLLESKKKTDKDADISISDQLNFIICGINGEKNIDLIDAAVEMMPAGDAKLLRKIYQKLIPNISIEKKYICRGCSQPQELEVPFTQEFFWPK